VYYLCEKILILHILKDLLTLFIPRIVFDKNVT